jgi:NAD-dependent deacetylase
MGMPSSGFVPMPVLADLHDCREALLAAVRHARHAVAFTGAGISTESGIPDFRSPGSIWTRMKPIPFGAFMASPEARREAWRRKFAVDDSTRGAKPSTGHHAIARLVAQGRIASVITQNIDGLHQASGVPAERVVELHGNGTFATCLDCGVRHELEDVRRAFEASEAAPSCEGCGGFVKSATISFGQAMPEGEMARARATTLACDLFVAIGSSLVVFPAAGFPLLARENGATLIIINREPTELDDAADVVLRGEIGPILEPLLAFEAA